ncbi:hypothetical protein EV421DRAFT_1912116 [Armillaria borealis]|uniref:Uncharacterized protein n=1 Tax=Armillaria borealis TaxID=47425 RepID=A0AA39MEC7_9AGAR|nr:hypothetical protein EV421DRAFT_1912116 [Armillaria borealis]
MTAEMDRKRVKEWFQNHGSTKKTEASAIRINDIFPKRRTHALTAEEMYSQKFYATQVKPIVLQRKEGSMRGEVLKLIKDTMKEVFEAESEEVHQMVLQWVKEQVPLTAVEDSVLTPEMYAVAMKTALSQIKMFIAALSKATGCAIMTIMGGPDPCQNGKISSCGFHAGEDPQGRTFGQVFPNFKETYLSPFTQFL